MIDYAILDPQGNVTNVIVLADDAKLSSTVDSETGEEIPADWTPPDNHTIQSVGDNVVSIGWVYANGSFSDPNPPIVVTESLSTQAQNLLKKSDITVLRCFSAGISLPAEWQQYRINLRGVIDGTITTLPTTPAYPQGT